MIPFVSIPGVATPEGMTVPAAFANLEDGSKCFLELPHSGCHGRHTFLLLAGYCALNFVYNTLGLVLTKRASSTTNAIAGSLLLPLTAVAFTAPALGQFREKMRTEAVYANMPLFEGGQQHPTNSFAGTDSSSSSWASRSSSTAPTTPSASASGRPQKR